jgi:hypothetical protein
MDGHSSNIIPELTPWKYKLLQNIILKKYDNSLSNLFFLTFKFLKIANSAPNSRRNTSESESYFSNDHHNHDDIGNVPKSQNDYIPPNQECLQSDICSSKLILFLKK